MKFGWANVISKESRATSEMRLKVGRVEAAVGRCRCDRRRKRVRCTLIAILGERDRRQSENEY